MTPAAEHPATDEKLDLVWGADAIAAELGTSKRRAFYMLDTGALPAKKVAGRWVADRTVLRAFFRSGEAT